MKGISKLLVAYSALFAILISVFQLVKHKFSTLQNSKMPAFQFFTQAGGSFTQDSIPKQYELVAITHFQPDCHFCEDFSNTLLRSQGIDLEKNLLVMVASARKKDISSFLKRYPIHSLPGVIVLQDSLFKFNHYFGAGGVPNTFLFDANRTLIEHFKGDFPIEKLSKQLQ